MSGGAISTGPRASLINLSKFRGDWDAAANNPDLTLIDPADPSNQGAFWRSTAVDDTDIGSLGLAGIDAGTTIDEGQYIEIGANQWFIASDTTQALIDAAIAANNTTQFADVDDNTVPVKMPGQDRFQSSTMEQLGDGGLQASQYLASDPFRLNKQGAVTQLFGGLVCLSSTTDKAWNAVVVDVTGPGAVTEPPISPRTGAPEALPTQFGGVGAVAYAPGTHTVPVDIVPLQAGDYGWSARDLTVETDGDALLAFGVYRRADNRLLWAWPTAKALLEGDSSQMVSVSGAGLHTVNLVDIPNQLFKPWGGLVGVDIDVVVRNVGGNLVGDATYPYLAATQQGFTVDLMATQDWVIEQLPKARGGGSLSAPVATVCTNAGTKYKVEGVWVNGTHVEVEIEPVTKGFKYTGTKNKSLLLLASISAETDTNLTSCEWELYHNGVATGKIVGRYFDKFGAVGSATLLGRIDVAPDDILYIYVSNDTAGTEVTHSVLGVEIFEV